MAAAVAVVVELVAVAIVLGAPFVAVVVAVSAALTWLGAAEVSVVENDLNSAVAVVVAAAVAGVVATLLTFVYVGVTVRPSEIVINSDDLGCYHLGFVAAAVVVVDAKLVVVVCFATTAVG